MKDFFSIFTFFSFKVFLRIFFVQLLSYFASSFYDITFLFAAPCCIFVTLLSCLRLLVACGFHHVHLCNFIVVIFAVSSLSKALSKFHYICLLLHYFVACLFLFCFIGLQSFYPTSYHCFPKLLEKSSLFLTASLFSCMSLLCLPSSISKASRKELFLSLRIHCFLARFLPIFHHCSPKLWKRNSFFACRF